MEILRRKFSWQLAGAPCGQLWSQRVRLVTGRGWERCHLQRPWRAGRGSCLALGTCCRRQQPLQKWKWGHSSQQGLWRCCGLEASMASGTITWQGSASPPPASPRDNLGCILSNWIGTVCTGTAGCNIHSHIRGVSPERFELYFGTLQHVQGAEPSHCQPSCPSVPLCFTDRDSEGSAAAKNKEYF